MKSPANKLKTRHQNFIHSHKSLPRSLSSARQIRDTLLRFALPPLVLSPPAQILHLLLASPSSLLAHPTKASQCFSPPSILPSSSSSSPFSIQSSSKPLAQSTSSPATQSTMQSNPAPNPTFEHQLRKRDQEFHQMRTRMFDMKIRIHHLETQLHEKQARRMSTAPPDPDDFYGYDDEDNNNQSSSPANKNVKPYSQFSCDADALKLAQEEITSLREDNDELVSANARLEVAVDAAAQRDNASTHAEELAARREAAVASERDAAIRRANAATAAAARADARCTGLTLQVQAAQTAAEEATAKSAATSKKAEAFAIRLERKGRTAALEDDPTFPRMPGAADAAALDAVLIRLRGRGADLSEQGYVPEWRKLVAEQLNDCMRALACSAREVAARRKVLGLPDDVPVRPPAAV